MNYYNEHDLKTAAWLRELVNRELIPKGHVDTRSITDVTASDLRGYTQCHFFAGIGGWSLALQLAGWPASRPVWTGSCPCQPFSAAGKQLGEKDERHLWPVFSRLIAECRPEFVFGEQVANAIGKGWLDGVSADLEANGYACGAAVLGAHSVGAPHIRQRLYWVAHSDGGQLGFHPERGRYRRSSGIQELADGGRLGNPEQPRLEGHPGHEHDGHQPGRVDPQSVRPVAEASRGVPANGRGLPGNTSCGIPHPGGDLGERRQHESERGPEGRDADRGSDAWAGFDLIPCADGKTRRIESGLAPLAHGIPARVVRLRGYGNAIVPQVAAAFIESCVDVVTASHP